MHCFDHSYKKHRHRWQIVYLEAIQCHWPLCKMIAFTATVKTLVAASDDLWLQKSSSPQLFFNDRIRTRCLIVLKTKDEVEPHNFPFYSACVIVVLALFCRPVTSGPLSPNPLQKKWRIQCWSQWVFFSKSRTFKLLVKVGDFVREAR